MKAKNQWCLNCQQPLDSTKSINRQNDQPESGDISVCFYCGNISEFDEAGNLTTISNHKLHWLRHHQRRDYELLHRTRALILAKNAQSPE